MYRNCEEIIEALIEGKTSIKNVSRYIYNYRKNKKYDLALMWYKAKIVYEGEYVTRESD